MGAGGSTDSRSSPISATPLPHRQQASAATIIEQPKAIKNDELTTQEDTLSSHSHIHSQIPSEQCCTHFKNNHARHSAKLSERDVKQQKFDQNSLDEEIEEIVANTLDLPNASSDAEVRRVVRDSQNAISPNGSSRSRTRVPFLESSVEVITKPNVPSELQVEEDRKNEEDAKESIADVDFAKFKKVNHKDPPMKRNGKTVHHQDSDLLWRLGLISPEAYTHKKATRSAPSVHGEYLKPPSYDLTEEQLMANIEKEFAEYAATV